MVMGYIIKNDCITSYLIVGVCMGQILQAWAWLSLHDSNLSPGRPEVKIKILVWALPGPKEKL